MHWRAHDTRHRHGCPFAPAVNCVAPAEASAAGRRSSLCALWSSTRRPNDAIANGRADVVAGDIGRQIAGAVALTSRGLAVVPLIFDDNVALVDVSGRRPVSTVPTGIAPFAAVVNAAGTVAYVSNWGDP